MPNLHLVLREPWKNRGEQTLLAALHKYGIPALPAPCLFLERLRLQPWSCVHEALPASILIRQELLNPTIKLALKMPGIRARVIP